MSDALIEQLDAQRHNYPQLPAYAQGPLLAEDADNFSPPDLINNFAVRYNLSRTSKAPGVFELKEFTPFFLIQLNGRILSVSGTRSSLRPASVLGKRRLEHLHQ